MGNALQKRKGLFNMKKIAMPVINYMAAFLLVSASTYSVHPFLLNLAMVWFYFYLVFIVVIGLLIAYVALVYSANVQEFKVLLSEPSGQKLNHSLSISGYNFLFRAIIPFVIMGYGMFMLGYVVSANIWFVMIIISYGSVYQLKQLKNSE